MAEPKPYYKLPPMIRELIEDIAGIALAGELPDGDGVDVSTGIWAEGWMQKLVKNGFVAN